MKKYQLFHAYFMKCSIFFFFFGYSQGTHAEVSKGYQYPISTQYTYGTISGVPVLHRQKFIYQECRTLIILVGYCKLQLNMVSAPYPYAFKTICNIDKSSSQHFTHNGITAPFSFNFKKSNRTIPGHGRHVDQLIQHQLHLD